MATDGGASGELKLFDEPGHFVFQILDTDQIVRFAVFGGGLNDVGTGFDGGGPVQRVVRDMKVRWQGYVVVDHQCKLVFLQFTPADQFWNPILGGPIHRVGLVPFWNVQIIDVGLPRGVVVAGDLSAHFVRPVQGMLPRPVVADKDGVRGKHPQRAFHGRAERVGPFRRQGGHVARNQQTGVLNQTTVFVFQELHDPGPFFKKIPGFDFQQIVRPDP